MRIARPIPSVSEQEKKRFWLKVDSSGGQNACWPWMGYLTAYGYGAHFISGLKRFHSHRIAYVFSFGDAPVELEVCHQCDNRRCCNPAHLKLGTHSQNLKEAYQRGRRGPNLEYRRKIKMGELPSEKQHIISLRGGGKTIRQIAGATGFSLSTIQRWLKFWKGELN